MAERKQPVTVREGAIVYYEGRAHHAGDQLDVPASEAKALTEQGVVEKSKRAGVGAQRPRVT
jgi:hypothetical protein